MPGMGGIETVRRLRKIVGAGVTIIIQSAYDYAAIEAEAREAGADDFITKPLFRSCLLTALKASAEGKARQRKRQASWRSAACDWPAGASLSSRIMP